ncbi:MAG TPA: DegQ family serine endoprotease [Candidatus Binatia bacterium]|nr:DegQ family serine endoprotease [Candidatus Binatia bacterium]
MRYRKIGTKELVVVALSLLLLGYVTGERLDLFSPDGVISRDNAFAATEEPSSFVAQAKKLSPAIVNISTTQTVEAPQLFPDPFQSPFGEDDPFGEYWRRFFRGPFPYQAPSRQRSLGSGFIIEADGFILTNNHVVTNAEQILVKLSDGRELDAKIIGKDPKTDIALIKIDAAGELPTVSLGDSNKLQVGEWVMAIGNPFGLAHSITAGIVSAKGRVIGAGPYDNFIQTDASINPGNSGGPLVNMQGEVVGVNTAIFTRSGGNIGIGFAIPINLVKEILPQLKTKGKVVRGWLGIAIQRVTPTLADGLGLEKPRGALVANVDESSPAERGGMKVGDVIIEFDGRKIEQSDDLPRVVARTPVAKQVQVHVIRDKKEMTLPIVIGELKEEEVVVSAKEKENLGLTVQNVTPQIAHNLGLDREEGVVVTSVRPGSAADEAGLWRGDVILEVDRKPIENLSDFQKAVRNIKKNEVILVLVDRGETTLFLTLRATG